nr:MAG TPA: hypothetical protein [Caudoviricetes sp.]
MRFLWFLFVIMVLYVCRGKGLFPSHEKEFENG